MLGIVEASSDITGGERWGTGCVPEEEVMGNIVVFPQEKGVITVAVLPAGCERANPVFGAFEAELAVLRGTC